MELHQTLVENIPGNDFVIFGNSSRIIFLEKEAELYLPVIRNFVERAIARKQYIFSFYKSKCLLPEGSLAWPRRPRD